MICVARIFEWFPWFVLFWVLFLVLGSGLGWQLVL